MRWRHRHTLVEANECGLPAEGLSVDAVYCNQNIPCVASVDCQFSTWGTWSHCSGKYDGVRERSRTIAVNAQGAGLVCAGSMKQLAPCAKHNGCLDFTDDKFYLNLNTIKSITPSYIRYGGVDELPTLSCPFPATQGCRGRLIDLVVYVTYGSLWQPFNASANGKTGSTFGIFTVAPGSSVDLNFRFVDAITGERVYANKAMFKLFGLTQDNNGHSQQQVTAVALKDYFLTPDTEIAVAVYENAVTFAASNLPNSLQTPVPQSPSILIGEVESRSLELLFVGVADVNMTFKVSTGVYYRSFLWAGKACFGAQDCEVDPLHLYNAQPIDCVLSPWSIWGPCDTSCGVGQQQRTRHILQPPSRGGFACTGDMALTRECINQPCPDACLPVDCRWEEWSQWGVCDRCGGVMRRNRHILQHPQCGGQDCALSAAEEVKNCTRSCTDRGFCVWDEWTAFGPCTATCGNALQSRHRFMKSVNQIIPPIVYGAVPPNYAGFQGKFEELPETVKLQSNRFQVLALAFGAGAGSLAALVATLRVFGVLRIRRTEECASRTYENLGRE
jgi:hypothetical protein